MSDFGRCPVCKRYDFVGSHRCPPAWRGTCEEWGLEDVLVYAEDAKAAAKNLADRWDEDCSLYQYERPVKFKIRPVLGDEEDETEWEVCAEPVMQYYAKQVTNENQKNTKAT